MLLRSRSSAREVDRIPRSLERTALNEDVPGTMSRCKIPVSHYFPHVLEDVLTMTRYRERRRTLYHIVPMQQSSLTSANVLEDRRRTVERCGVWTRSTSRPNLHRHGWHMCMALVRKSQHCRYEPGCNSWYADTGPIVRRARALNLAKDVCSISFPPFTHESRTR